MMPLHRPALGWLRSDFPIIAVTPEAQIPVRLSVSADRDTASSQWLQSIICTLLKHWLMA